MSETGTERTAELPEAYVDYSGEPVNATVVEVPFRPSVNPSAREIASAAGRDSAY